MGRGVFAWVAFVLVCVLLLPDPFGDGAGAAAIALVAAVALAIVAVSRLRPARWAILGFRPVSGPDGEGRRRRGVFRRQHAPGAPGRPGRPRAPGHPPAGRHWEPTGFHLAA